MNRTADDAIPLLDDDAPLPAPTPPPWLVLVVDDDPMVHSVTRLCYADFRYDGRAIQMLSAASAAEARTLLAQTPGIALVLLDVVMESEHAGLDLARHIRDDLGNRTVRIVLRTGQPGQAPPRDVVQQYEIDDYRTKTELTFERLHVLTVTALRTYRLLRQQAERERRIAQYAEELERFTYAASHDLQTPLRSIVGFAQRLQDRFGGQLAGDAAAYLGYVVQGAHELHTLIEDLLTFTSIGMTQREPLPVELNSVVTGACTRMQNEISARNAVVDNGALPVVNGDRALLELLFAQLIDNALKFQPGVAPVVSIAATTTGEECEIRVSDRGIGIDAQHLTRIFEPFQRLHPTGRFPGTGIGLAICRKIVHLHGGNIFAQSVPGTGTTLVITLPLVPASATPAK
jgi:signal transduction histidine kinase